MTFLKNFLLKLSDGEKYRVTMYNSCFFCFFYVSHYYYPSAGWASGPFQWERDSLNVTKDTKHNKHKYGHVRQRNSEAGLEMPWLVVADEDGFIHKTRSATVHRNTSWSGTRRTDFMDL